MLEIGIIIDEKNLRIKKTFFFIILQKKTAKLFNDVLMRRKVPLSVL